MSNDRKVDSMSNDKWVEEFENKMQYVFRVIRKESLGIEQKEKFVYCDVLTEFKDFIKQLLEEQRKEVAKDIIELLQESLMWLESDGSGHLDSQVYAIPEETIEQLEQKYLGGE